MTELQKPKLEPITFDIFNPILSKERFIEIKPILSEERFIKIQNWLNKPDYHKYLTKEGDLENFDCGESKEITGFDVPVLIKSEKGNHEKLMIIVGESPLRKGSEQRFLVGFPFAVDYTMGKPSQCDVYKKLFNELLGEGYDLYITDIIKVWSKSESKNLKVTEEDNDVLNLELGTLSNMYDNKIHILLMGNNAQKWKIKYEGSLIRKITEIKIPHMSQQNWHTWRIKKYEDTFRRLIKENKITEENIKDLLVNNKTEFRSMDADIVVNTALNDIRKQLD